MLAARPLSKTYLWRNFALPAPSDAVQLPCSNAQGHSGARVMLCLRGTRSVVRIDGGFAGSEFTPKETGGETAPCCSHTLPFPRVLEEGVDEDGCAFCGDDYIPARTIASIVATARLDEISMFAAVERALALFR